MMLKHELGCNAAFRPMPSGRNTIQGSVASAFVQWWQSVRLYLLVSLF